MTTNGSAADASPFACDMNALEPAVRAGHIATVQELFQAVQAIRELGNGYAFLLPKAAAWLQMAATFVANERRCCPFFGFSIEVEPEGGPLWLCLTGRDGVKPFIQAEIGAALDDTVAKAAGFR